MSSKARVQFRIQPSGHGYPSYRLQLRYSLWGFTIYWETVAESDRVWELHQIAWAMSRPEVDEQVYS